MVTLLEKDTSKNQLISYIKKVLAEKTQVEVGTSSWSCCNFSLKLTTTDDFDKFGPAAAQIFQENFRVDEILRTVENKSKEVPDHKIHQ